MELKQGKISITYDELCRIRKMGRDQMERYLTEEIVPYLKEAKEIGYRKGYTDSEAETDAELRLAEADSVVTLSMALEERDRKWKKAVWNAVAATRGIGKKRKELLMEYIKIEMEHTGICRK